MRSEEGRSPSRLRINKQRPYEEKKGTEKSVLLRRTGLRSLVAVGAAPAEVDDLAAAGEQLELDEILAAFGEPAAIGAVFAFVPDDPSAAIRVIDAAWALPVGVLVTPAPVVGLAATVELLVTEIALVAFGEPVAVSALFAVVPVMVIAVVAVVNAAAIAVAIPILLGGGRGRRGVRERAGPNGYGGQKSAGEKYRAQVTQ